MATRRLLKERASLEKKPLDYAEIEVVNDDIHHWRVTLHGPPSTPYEKGRFVLDFAFPDRYPFKPPKIMFVTEVYHPNVKRDTGEICNDVLNEGWGPTLDVRHCLKTIRGVLENPDPDHPLEADIAEQLRSKPKDFEKAATKHTKEHAVSR